MSRSAVFSVLCAGLAFCGSARAAEDTSREVLELVARTKTVARTYALYSWNVITPPGGQVIAEWAAEFNRGNAHRVETPRDRVVADCDVQSGTWYFLPSDKVQQGPGVAGVACGINTNKRMISARVLSHGMGPFGPVTRIEVIDPDDVRTYTLTTDGLIVAATIAPANHPDQLVLDSWAVAVTPDLPDPDIFTQDSLRKSAVPEKFRTAPPR